MTSSDPKLKSVLFYQVEQTMRQTSRYTHRVFAEAGVDLTKDQWLVLKMVHDEDGVPPLEIAKTLGKEPASMTRMIDILVRKEFLIRKRNPEDRRSQLLFPTNVGSQLYNQVLPLVKEIRQQAVTGLSEDQVANLEQMLAQIRDNMR